MATSDLSMRKEEARFKKLYKTVIEQDALTSLSSLLERSARLFSHDIALVCDDQSVSYGVLYKQACAIASELAQRGITTTSTVIVLLENSIAFYQAYFGILQAGAIVVPVNIFLHEQEVSYIIQDAQAPLLICSPERAEKLRGVMHDMPTVLDTQTLESIIIGASDNLCTPKRRDFNECAVLLYTSGTTGSPKGVMLSSKNVLTNVIQAIARFGITQQQRVLAVLPLFHSYAQNICIWASFMVGCTVIIVPKIERRAIMQAFAKGPTLVVAVPAFFGLLCLLKNCSLATVDYFFSGGDMLPDKIRTLFALTYRRKIGNGYGITEASPIVSVDMADHAGPTSRAGKPLIGVECSIRNAAGQEVPQGDIGELWLHGDTVMLGYFNAPEVTQAVFKNGWFCTGDLAYIDIEGNLTITGRVKDLIIHKGIKIYPAEVENIIMLSPNVLATGVVGQQEPNAGEYPVAFVQLRHEDPMAEESLKKLCKEHLATYKIPRKFFCSTKPLPATATGKIDKKILRTKLLEHTA